MTILNILFASLGAALMLPVLVMTLETFVALCRRVPWITGTGGQAPHENVLPNNASQKHISPHHDSLSMSDSTKGSELASASPWEHHASAPRVAVLIPAHNEETGIAATVESVRSQMNSGDRVLVVADNCNDTTASVARASGAEVVERVHATDRGKGFALDFGMRHLADDPPEIVLILDADCRLADGALATLSDAVMAQDCPVQARFLYQADPRGGALRGVSILALQFRGLIRKLGADSLGTPCLLMGTGMAFPWNLLQQANLATGHLVEDLQLAIDLALAGTPAKFCPEAAVHFCLPNREPAFITQRTRWEHGHLASILHQAPRLIGTGLIRFRPALILMGLHLAVPPLAFLMSVMLAGTVATGVWTLFVGSPVGLSLFLGALTLMGISIGLGWLRFLRDEVPFCTFLGIPGYVLRKLPIYLRFLRRPETRWVRTERDTPATN